MIDALSKNISPPSTCVSYRKQDKTLPEKITWPTIATMPFSFFRNQHALDKRLVAIN